MSTDDILLKQYARGRDADAFAEIVSRHAGMVYGACLRVTGKPQDAEDVAQECFMELARNAGSAIRSVPGWLHTVATRRSVNVIRDSARRRRHEEQAMDQKQDQTGSTWAEVAPRVDEALEELPQELKAALVLRYLEGLSQIEIATQLGVNQSTVSRRIDKGLERLRRTLKRAGVTVSGAILGTLLAENAAQAAPATLAAALGKMAMAGVGEVSSASVTAVGSSAGASSSAAGGTALGTLHGKFAIGAAVTILAAAGAVLQKTARNADRRPPVKRAAAAPATKPAAAPRAKRYSRRQTLSKK